MASTASTASTASEGTGAPRLRRGRRRVVVTGVGAVSAIGVGIAPFLAGLRSGRESARPITRFDTTGFDRVHGCQIDDFDPADWLRRLTPAEAGRATLFAAAAARMAVQDAGIEDEELTGRPVLVAVGTTDGEAGDWDTLVDRVTCEGFAGLDPDAVARVPAGKLSALVARELGLHNAEAVTFATACAAGNYAIGYGFDVVAGGEVDIALCGGAEALGRLAFAGFTRLGAVASRHCQPFDEDREGIITGEGGAVLVLEDLESARARGARVLAEVLGHGLNCDAGHPVAPDRGSVAECMRLALADAGVAPRDVDFVSAHGTATRANDVAEAGAVRDVFGAATAPRTVGLKSMLGHSMGAASALASVACVLAIAEGFIPPTVNHVRTDPECAIDCVPNTALQVRPTVVQNNALAFGGNNAVVLYGAFDDGPAELLPRRMSTPMAVSASNERRNPVITAWSAVSPMGLGTEDFAAGIRSGHSAISELDPEQWPVPYDRAGLVPGFDMKRELGGGVRSLDRQIGFAALAVSRLAPAPGPGQDSEDVEESGSRTAVVLGTSTTPVQGVFDFGRDTWVNAKPYHVDARRFTTMVMNAAASQCAIRYRLRGPNSTIAAGRVAGLAALQYGVRLHRSGRADAVICGSAIEFSSARAWMSSTAHSRQGFSPPGSRPQPQPLGEGAVTWLLEPPDRAAAQGRPVLAEVLGLRFGVAATPDEAESVLEDQMRRLLSETGVATAEVWAVAHSGTGGAETAAIAEVFGDTPLQIRCAPLIGDTEHASAAFAIGAVLAHAGSARAADRCALIVSADIDGLVGCALLRM